MSTRATWRFRDGVMLMGLVGLAFAATRFVWADIIEIGMNDEENSYVLLAPAVAIWLMWMRRERLRYCAPRWTPLGPLLIAVGWGMMIPGYDLGIDIALHLGALMVVGGAALTMMGLDFVRAFVPVVASLLFLLPTPGTIRTAIAAPLQELSAGATYSLLEVFGVPVVWEGSLLTINGHEVAVAEACNGMRMVSALFLVTFAFVFSLPMRQGIRLAFLILSPVIALIVNIIRLTPTVLMYGYAEETTATAFHDISGWVILLVALVVLWGMLQLLRWLEVPVAPYTAGEA